MQTILDLLSAFGSFLDGFLEHGSAVSMLLSLGVGWGAAIAASFPIHRVVADDALATYYSRLVAIGGSFFITLFTWPNEWRVAWALFMAVMNPILGLIALHYLSRWKPDIAEQLSMKKTTKPSNSPNPEPPTGDME